MRFATGQADVLEPHAARVGQRFNLSIGRQIKADKDFSDEQMAWLRAIKDYLAANVFEERIDTSDLMSMSFTPAEFERFRLRHGDILLNEGQSMELVGRPARHPALHEVRRLHGYREDPHQHRASWRRALR